MIDSGIHAVRHLDVFLSSDQKEFQRIRRILSQRISQIPFFNCTLMEESGADPEDVRSASLRAVSRSDILIGILGAQYSELAVEEYHEAVRMGKQILIYIKKVKDCNPRIVRLIEEHIEPNFKYHRFKTGIELYQQVNDDLWKLLTELISKGLEQSIKTKMETVRIEKEFITPSPTADDAILDTDALLEKVLIAKDKSQYLESIIILSIAIELELRQHLISDEYSPDALKYKPLGALIRMAKKEDILSKSNFIQLLTITHLRNRAIHEGQPPTRDDCLQAIEYGIVLIHDLHQYKKNIPNE